MAIDKNHPDITNQLELIQDNTIVPFKPRLVPVEAPTPAPGEPVVDRNIEKMLEYYLKQVRAGKITFVALASVDAGGGANSTWAPESFPSPSDTTKALGAVAYLNSRFNSSVVDCEDNDGDSWDVPEGPTKA